MKVFVAWDSELASVGHTFRDIVDDPPQGLTVEILGTAGSVAVGLLEQRLSGGIGESHGLLAVMDRPNANVGWELGFALARGLRVAFATEGKRNPPWVRGTPLATALRQGGVGGGGAAEAVLGEFNKWPRLDPPRRGSRRVVVCANAGPGERWRGPMHRDLDGWDLVDVAGWTLAELPTLLADLDRLALVVLPRMSDDERHGVPNTVGALLAGYAEGLGAHVAAFFPAGADDLADLGHRRKDVVGSRAGLLSAIQAWSDSLTPRPRHDPLGEYLTCVSARHAGQLAYVARLGLNPGELVPVDLEVEVNGPTRRLEPGAVGEDLCAEDPRGRTGLLHELVEADLATGRVPRWLVKAEPGAGKTTMLWQLAARLATTGGPVPVVVGLADWEARGDADPFVAAARQVGAAPAVADALRARAGAERGVWLLLDGFDEVSRHEEMHARVMALAGHWSRVVVVVTTRAGALTPGHWRNYTHAQVEHLDANDQELLAGRLLGSAEAARRFTDAMRRLPGVAVLLRNPFLLTLAAGLHAQATDRDEAPPLDRTSLLGRALDDALKRGWAPGAGEPPRHTRWDARAARHVLRALSLELHRRGGEAWDQDALSDALAGQRARYPAVAKVYGRDADNWYTADEFLADVRAYAGVLGPLDGPTLPWRFLHRSLREMLAAECLADELRQKARGVVVDELMAEATDDPRGGPARSAEVLALTAGRLMDGARPRVSEATAHLERLVRAAPEVAKRALAGVERVDAATHLRLFLEAGAAARYDNDELDAVVDAIARGRGLEGLWAGVPEVSDLAALGVWWYALERVETRGGAWTEAQRVERAERFFAAAGLADRPRPAIDGVALRGGTFWMGSPEGVGENREHPRHEEQIGPFTLGRTTVTVAQFRVFDRSAQGAADLPATRVDWFTARLFAEWIGGRLPTEVEWEFACRAGTDTAYSFGDDEARLGDHAWFAENSAGRLHPVGQKRPNSWGLYDMHGNVWEWCESRFAAFNAAASRGPVRVLRGGACWLVAGRCRSAFRYWDHPRARYRGTGFRVVLPAGVPSGSSVDHRP